ncbi:hypothetical protein HZU77_013495 [Neisseriaceae bacterium TC5R-5]|nr:hypothetical protein [Neisseriaceae bacterium TC5R-5]
MTRQTYTALPRVSNQQLLQAVNGISEAMVALAENNFVILAVELSSVMRPTIRVQHSSQCQRLIERGEAVHFGFGRVDHIGRYQQGQFNLGGCRVVWTEFKH